MIGDRLESPLKVGIVGTGFAAKLRAETIQNDERTRLVAVAGHGWEATVAFSQTYNALPVESWQQLVQQDLDLAIICTINSEHSAIARAALESGKHAIVEYPLALDPKEAQSLLNLAQSQDKLLHVEHIELLGGLHQALRQNFAEIGNAVYARYVTIVPQRPVPRRWTFHREQFGFPLSGALSRIHRLTDLFGNVASVSSQIRYWDAEEGYYTACLCSAQLRFTSGAIADAVYGKGDVFWQGLRDFEIHGDRGTLSFQGDRGTLIRGDETTPIEVAGRRGLFVKDTTMVLDHLFQGTPLYVNPAASCYALEVADAARRSSETGETVYLEHRA